MAANPLEAMSNSILRFIFWSAVISLPYVAAGAGTGDRAAHDQQVFPTPTPQPHGILRRFTQKDSNHLAETHDLDIWQIATQGTQHVDIYSPRPRLASRVPFCRPRTLLAISALQFHIQSETDEFIQELARLYSESVTIVQLGHTAEGREMLGTKISTSALVPGMKSAAPKLGFVVLGPQHARECDRLPKDAEDEMEALLGAAQAGRSVYGTPFNMRRLALICSASGNILDHMYSTAGIKYAYAAFLRDMGTYGFAIPPEWIRPVGEETGVSAYAPKPEFVF
ncbi:hypothetical protein B0H14DRAFT_2578995 [Mycena olivaceomarginata]|nr:hypothetical protein B0H14DRAFT_2578995 [Mycena olivaceomarginata]